VTLMRRGQCCLAQILIGLHAFRPEHDRPKTRLVWPARQAGFLKKHRQNFFDTVQFPMVEIAKEAGQWKTQD
jgi:hypothetical protein